MKMKQSSSLDSSHYSSSRSQRGAAMATTPSSLYTGRRTEASTGDMLRRAFAPRAKAWIYGVKPSGRLGDRDASDMRNFVSPTHHPSSGKSPPPRPRKCNQERSGFMCLNTIGMIGVLALRQCHGYPSANTSFTVVAVERTFFL